MQHLKKDGQLYAPHSVPQLIRIYNKLKLKKLLTISVGAENRES